MRWPDDLAGWPLAEYSRQVLCRPHRWHIQEAGKGETLILIHGAGGATHSWRGVFPILAQHFHVVAIDLPGLGFTQVGARHRMGLAPIAEDLATLMKDQGWQPKAIIGHSAGAAVGLQLLRNGLDARVIGINAALSNFGGVAGWLFPFMAKALALNPLSSRLVSKTATPGSVKGLIKGTGSDIGPEGEALYLRLTRDRSHVDATLSMMSQWSLDRLVAGFPKITQPVDLIITDGDTAVPNASSIDAAKRLPNAQVHLVKGLGHLAHEEDPVQICALIERCLR